MVGDLEANLHPLKDLDTFTESRLTRGPLGALELVVYNCPTYFDDKVRFQEHVQIMSQTPLKDLLRLKWIEVTRMWYWLWCLEYVLFLIIFSVAISLRPNIWASPYYPSVAVGALEIIITLHYLLSYIIEIRDLIYMRRHYFSCFGLFTLLVWIANAAALGAFICRFLQYKENEEVCMAIAVTCSWLYLLHLVRSIPRFTSFVVMITEVFSHDLPLFIFLYVVILMGFAAGFHLLFQRDKEPGYNIMINTIYTLFTVTLGNYDPHVYLDANLPIPTLIAFIIFLVVSTILMLNIFIAQINSTYQRNIENRDHQKIYAVSKHFDENKKKSLCKLNLSQ